MLQHSHQNPDSLKNWTYRFLLIFVLLLTAVSVQSATKTSTATGGTWSSGSTWIGGIIPQIGDAVVIATTGTGIVTVGSSTSCASLTVNSGSKLSLGSKTLTVSGSVGNAGVITFSSGRITQNGTGDFTNSGTITFTSSGRLYFTGSLTNTGTITLASSSIYFTGSNSAVSTVAGFTTTGGVYFQRTAGSVTFTGNVSGSTLSINGSGGTLNLGAGLKHTFTSAITLSYGTLNGGSSIVYINYLSSSAWTNNGGTFIAGTGTIILGGLGNQSVAGIITTTFNNLTLAGSGLKSLARVPIVNGTLSMEGTATASTAPTFGTSSTLQYKGTASVTTSVEFPTAFAGTGGVIIDQGSGNTVTLNATKTALAGNLNIKSGTFNLSTYTVNRASAGGTLTIAAGASLKIGGTNTLPSNYSTHSIDCAGTIEYAGTNQTVAIPNSSQTYGNLTLSGSGVKTLQTGITSICNNFTVTGTASTTGVTGLTIGGALDIESGATFTAGSFTHNIGGNWINSGTFNSAGSTINFNGGNSGNIGVSNFNHVIFSGSGIKTATGALTLSGNLNITNNFAGGNYVHTLAGNWTNNGTFTAGTSTISFTGTTTQTLTGTSPTTFYSLTMNGTGGTTLGLGITVSGLLTLTSGILTLGSYNLVAGAVSIGSAASYVKTNSTGILKLSVTSGTAVTFPVGNSAFNPIKITNTTTGNTDNYNIRVIDGALTNSNDNTRTVNRQWQITEDVAGGSALTVVASYNTGETGTNFNVGTTPTFGYFNGTSWSAPVTATASGSGPYTFTSGTGSVTSNDMTSTSGFLCLGSGMAFNASKLVITSINPGTPFVNQNNVAVAVQSQNSNNVPTNVSLNTNISLSAANTTLSGTLTGYIPTNSYGISIAGIGFTTLSTTATVTATRTSGDALSAGTSGQFSVVVGNIYKPKSANANWSTVQWQVSSNGGTTYTDTSAPTNFIFGTSDMILIPSSTTLNADVTASFYNIEIYGTLNLTTGTLTLNHSSGGNDYGFQVFGAFWNSGGTFINSNIAYPILIQGGTYQHNMNGGSIPVANWNSLSSTASKCQISGITGIALTSGLNQSFQNFIWNNASQTVIQNLTGNMSVSGTFNLNNGVLTTGSSYRVILTSTSSLSPSNNAWVNGNIRIFPPNATNNTYVIPIGDANYYTPVSVTFTGTTLGSGYLDATTTVTQPPLASGLSQSKYINRNWTLTNTGISGFISFSPTFTFVNADKTGTPNTSALVIRKLNGTSWTSTNIGTQGTNSTQCTGLTSFGTFAIGEDNCTATNAIWFGGTSTDWNTGSNWCGGTVPTSAVNVDIPADPANQPVINATANCGNITIESGASLTTNGSNTLNVYGNWSSNGTYIPASGTVLFTGTTAQTITGAMTFANLTINNAAGVSAANNITVKGVLNLQSNNASTSKGALDMSSNTLYMGLNSTTTGIGDVTGIVMRTHSFATSTFYSLGNINSGVIFADKSNQVFPTTLAVKVTLGAAPNWSGSLGDVIAAPITRIYDVLQIGGSGTSVIFRVHYRDNEIPSGINENKLTLWHRVYLGGSTYYVVEVGKSDQDVTNNFITIQDIDLANIPSSWGIQQEAIAPSQATVLTWVGGTTGMETNWNTATNWDPAAIPSPNYGVDIPDAATTLYNPILPAGTDSVASVLIESGGIMNTTIGANLVLTGANAVWTKESGGVFNAGTSTVTVSNLSGFSSFVGNTDFYNVTITDGANLRPGGDSYMGISGTLSLSSSGVLDAATNENIIEFKGVNQSIPNPNGSQPAYHNLTISGTGIKTLPATLHVMDEFTNNGTVNVGTGTVFMDGDLYGEVIGGSTPTAFNNLTINNIYGVTSETDITVNGVLTLQTVNPSATQGCLNMLDSIGTTIKTLTMGVSATTTGPGDVTGIVRRTTFVLNTPYTFGNQYSVVTFTSATTLPTEMKINISIGASPSWKTDAINRVYDIVQTGAKSCYGTIQTHYQDNELNGNIESQLSLWSYGANGQSPTLYNWGYSNYDYANNWLTIANMNFEYFPSIFGSLQETLATSNAISYTWNGSQNTDWANIYNWTPNGSPIPSSSVIIPNASTTTNSPTLPTLTEVGMLNIQAGGILNGGSGTLIIDGASGAWNNIGGTLNPGTSNVIFNNAAVTNSTTVATYSGSTNFYNLTINSGAKLSMQSGSSIKIAGAVNNSGGIWDTVTGGFTIVEYNGANQTVVIPDPSTNKYYSLVLNGSGIKTMPAAPLGILNDFIVQGTTTVAPNNTLIIGDSLSIGPAATFIAGSFTHSISGDFLNYGGTFNSTGSTIILNGTEDQLIGGTVPMVLNNLTISNTAATVSAASNLSCSGNFTNSGTLDMTNYILAVSGTITNTGILKTAVATATSVTPIPAGITWGGTIEYNANAGSQTAVKGTYNNMTISGLSGAIANTNLTVNGILNLAAPNPSSVLGILDMSTDTLHLGINSTVKGSSDVTGIVGRRHLFANNTYYTYNSANRGVTFTGLPDQTSNPLTFYIKNSIGTAPDWSSCSGSTIMVNPAKRIYSLWKAGNWGSSIGYFRANYQPTELDASVNASLLTIWAKTTSSETCTVSELGKSNQDLVNDFVTIGNISMSVFPAFDGPRQVTLAPTATSTLTWTGINSNDMKDATNWSPTGTPSSLYGLLIPDNSTTPYFPQLSDSITCKSMIIEQGGILNSTGLSKLALTGTGQVWLSEQGATFNSDNSTININCSTPSTISNIAGTATFNNLIVNSGSTLIPSAGCHIKINGTFSIESGGYVNTQVANNIFEFSGNTTQNIFNPTLGYNNLIFSGTGNKVLPATLDIVGNFENNSTFTSTGNSTYFNGITSQTIGGTVKPTFNNVYILNPSGVSLSTDSLVTIAGRLTIGTGSIFEIGAGKQLIADKITNHAGTNGLIIRSGQGIANGTLIFNNNADSTVLATVEMYSIASWSVSNGVRSNYKWQFFGIPVQSVIADPTFAGAFVRQYNESGNGSGLTSDKRWIQLTNQSSLSPFTGYEIVQTNPTTYSFTGALVNTDLNEPLTYTLSADYKGQHILSNPYTAAIDITKMTFGTHTEGTVYQYNTGSLNDWTANGGGSTNGTNPGQYVASTSGTAGFSTIPRQIPSMQGFLIICSALDNLSGTYSSLVMNNSGPQRVKSTTGTNSADKVYTTIDVKGSILGDRMWLFTEPTCSHNYDNGWDGRKMLGSALAPQLYAIESDGIYQIDVVDDINNTFLGFKPGQDTEYTLTFTHQNTASRYAGIYLIDLANNKMTDITATGSNYSFNVDSTNLSLVKRFKITTQLYDSNDLHSEDQVRIFSSQTTVFVQNQSNLDGDCIIYDVAGHFLNKVHFAANGLTTITNSLKPGVYIATAIINSKTVVRQSLIIQ